MKNTKTLIDIFYIKFTKHLSDLLWYQYIEMLPNELREINTRYRRWQDRHAHLFGKLLLIKGLRKYGFDVNLLSEMQFNKYGRPFINNEIDFNISHSGSYAICAITKNLRVGIDIEEIQKIDITSFSNVMTNEQWKLIKNSPDPVRSFFKFWTIKESVIKADSRGLSIPLLNIHLKNNRVEYDNQIWYLRELSIEKKYCSCLATNSPNITLNIEEIDFYDKPVFMLPQ